MRTIVQLAVTTAVLNFSIAHAGPRLDGADVTYRSSAHLIDRATHEPAMIAQNASSDRALFGGLLHYRQSAKVIDWRGPSFGNATFVQGHRELAVGELRVPLPAMTREHTQSFVAAVRVATK
jgi:hypothetical protein